MPATFIYSTPSDSFSQNVQNGLGAPQTVFTIDATITEKHKSSAQVTQHPVEQGADISDHVRSKPSELEITGLITDYPIGQTPQVGRAASIYRLMENAQANGSQFDITTSTKFYQGMVIESLTSDKDKDLAGAIRFVMSCIQIIEVETEQVVLSKTTEPKTKGNVNGGKQATVPATPQQTTRSLALSTLGAAGTALGIPSLSTWALTPPVPGS